MSNHKYIWLVSINHSQLSQNPYPHITNKEQLFIHSSSNQIFPEFFFRQNFHPSLSISNSVPLDRYFFNRLEGSSLGTFVLRYLKKNKMKNSPSILLTCAVVLIALSPIRTAYSAPSACTDDFKGRIIDITHQYTPDMPSYGTNKGLRQFLNRIIDMRINGKTTNSDLNMPVHSGTHTDAPSHVYIEYLEQGFDVDTLDLEVLNGPVLLVDVPRTMNISDVALKQINIPRGVKRVLFRTLNTDRKLMYQKPFDSSYVGFTESGAHWLVGNTDVKLVGIDYLSIAASDSLIPAHRVLLKNKDVILVEGLKLDNVTTGSYTLHCLPLRLKGADGSPTRCILIK